jgi:hypothetical protein
MEQTLQIGEVMDNKDKKIAQLEKALDFINASVAAVGRNNQLVQEAFNAQGDCDPEIMYIFIESFERLGIQDPDA